MWWQILVLVVVVRLLQIRWKKRKMIEMSRQLPNDILALPFLGHVHYAFGNDEDRMKSFKKFGYETLKHGGRTSLWVGNKLYSVLAEPLDIELVMKTCLEKDDVMKLMQFIIGNGIIIAPVPIWRPRRKFLLPTLNPKYLNQFAEIFARQSGVLVRNLQEHSGGAAFSVWKYIAAYTMDAVTETNLGIDTKSQQNFQAPFLEAFDQLCQIGTSMIVHYWFCFKGMHKLLPQYQALLKYKHMIRSIIDEIIQTKRVEMRKRKEIENEKIQEGSNTDASANRHKSNGQADLKTFLELLIESSGGDKGYNDKELREETLVITIAGTDTSAVGAGFTLLMLARHPDVQHKVYEELQEVFDESKRVIVAEDLPRLRYLEAVIRESLRLYPPAPFIVRKVETEVLLPCGVNLVPGTGVVINIWATNRNPKYWGKDAEKFKPERFLNQPLKHPAAFMTFSNGPRNCPGYQYAMMSMKTSVASILREFQVLPPTFGEMDQTIYTHREEPLRTKYDIMMKDVDNFVIRLKAR